MKNNNIFTRFGLWCKKKWSDFKEKHPTLAQFVMFFIISNGVTVLQLILMPLFRIIFAAITPGLVNTTFQFFSNW